ncbi:hypothetical protein NQ318_017150 [Aromia moschata]|uniref:DDE-1 domain-containing protein n=1 Tax=Aromia moschata TaxID=1265417 RepID=A0AAV8XZT5_9CUCU|nr:hypothetical protein NQ318_017150 [Aromia moschata]
MLEFAEEHNIIILSLPSHTPHFLPPLDRAEIKYYYYYYYNPGRKISRLQFGVSLSEAWGKAATCSNAISGFRATGMYPYNPETIPEYAFATNENPNVASEPKEGPSRLLHSDTPHVLVEPTPDSPSRSDITPGKLLEKLSPVTRIEAIE